jgi:hypothetical protein
VGVPLLEFDHAGAAGRTGQHGAGNPADLARVIERPEGVPVQVDPQAGFRAGQDLLDRRLRLLSGPVDERLHQPAQRRARRADDDRHGLPVSLLAKTLAAVSWQDRSRPDNQWSQRPEQKGHDTMVEEPSDGVDLDRLLDLTTPWCLRVAATLGIPGHITAGHRDIADLAVAAGCDADALHAVLAHLVSHGVFTEDAPGRFSCNRAARQLADASRFIDLDGIGGRMAHTWGTLLDYVRTGQPAYAKVFGRPFWEDLAAHPRIAADFDALMGPAGHGVPDYDIELSGGWEPVRTVVDVGGGTGALLASLLRRHPQVRGILVDLPGTVARAGQIMAEAGVTGRVTVAGQSFFDPLPAGADLYLLKSVLNDWPDEPTVALLRRCAQAARPGGSVVVLGGVSADEAPRTLGIDMLVAGGKTSTLAQFTELARQAGLDILAAGPQPSGRYQVECRPAPEQAAEGRTLT